MSPELVLHVHNAKIVIAFRRKCNVVCKNDQNFLSGVSDSNIKHWSLSATLIAHLLTVKGLSKCFVI